MSTPKATVLEKHTFSREVLEVFDLAEKIAMELSKEELLCVHVFVACAYLKSDVLHQLLGREITQIPQEYEIDPDDYTKTPDTQVRTQSSGANPEERNRMEDEFEFIRKNIH